MQLDLFAHSRDVSLRNDLATALLTRDAAAGRRGWAALAAEYPDDRLLAPAAVLLEALERPSPRLTDAAAAARAVEDAETRIARAAAGVFDAREAARWLVPVWRSLALAAGELPYDPTLPAAHAATMWLRAGDLAAVEAAVGGIPSWRRIPVPLAWMIEARVAQAGLAAVWPLLAELAWLDPVRFGSLARRLDAPALEQLVHDFDGGFEADGDSDLVWFPAWAAIAEPRLAPALREAQASRSHPPEQAARLVLEMLALERQGRHAELIADRQRLRALHAGLFERYMRTR